MLKCWQFFFLMLMGCIQLALQSAIILILFKKDINIKRVIIYTFIFTILYQIPVSLYPAQFTAIALVFYLILGIFTIRFILGLDYINSFFAAAFIFITTIIKEYVYMGIYKIPMGNYFSFYDWPGSFISAVIAKAICIFLALVAFIILNNLEVQLEIPEETGRRKTFVLVMALIIKLLVIIPIITFFMNNISNTPASIYFFNALSLFSFLLSNTYSIMKFSELDAKSQQVEFQKLYIDTLNETINELRGFKHDFNNMIQVIDGYLKLNNIEGLKNYHKQILGEVRKINNTMPLNSYLQDFPALYGMLLSKMSYSEVNDITFNISISTEIDIKNMKTLDFCKIIGILLDNAFEAASETEEKVVEFIIHKNINNNSITIQISNTCREYVDIHKIYESGYTTKKDHLGFGLYEVKKILKKYNNVYLDTFMSDSFFTQKLVIM